MRELRSGVIVVPEIAASQVRSARASKMPLKSSPTYATGRGTRSSYGRLLA
jgi:hypothetical protein